jgi:erythromycin esterase
MSPQRKMRHCLGFFGSTVFLILGCSIGACSPSIASQTAADTQTPRPPSATPSPTVPTATPTIPTPAEWLAERAIPFSGTEPGTGFADLAPLKTLVGRARIVSLGEATHGTHEFFAMKHRILEYLVQEMGFTVFAIETNMPDAELVNQYVLTGRGDPASMISRFHWPWFTQEVLDLVEWMRDYNETHGESAPVHFAGFDMQESWRSSENVLAYMQSVDPGEVESIKGSYACLRKYGNNFGSATSEYPKESAEARTECRNNLQAVYDLLTERRDRYAERSSVREFDWARQCAGLVLQFEEMLSTMTTDTGTRDRHMAENVSWLADIYYPGDRMVLWAHNLHVSQSAHFRTMGYHLRNRYGSDIVNFGFSFHHGGFNAIRKYPDGTFGDMTVFELDGPFPDGIENYFHPLGEPGFFLDMRGIEEDPGADRLFRMSRMNFSGALFDAEGRLFENFSLILAENFDVLIHVDVSTPTHLLGQWGSIPIIRVARAGPTPTPSQPGKSAALEWNFEDGIAPWVSYGNPESGYVVEIDRTVAHGGNASVRIQSVGSSAKDGFASFMYMLSAAPYRGKTARLSAYLRAEDVTKFAGLWIRVQDVSGTLAYVNSEDQFTSGDTEWTQIRLELRLPENSEWIFLGAILEGEGTVWVDGFRFEAG